MVKTLKKVEEAYLNPEFVDEVRELEKEPITRVKDLKKHFK